MFKAIGRFFNTLGSLFSGRINERTDAMAENPHVVGEEYNEVIENKMRQVRDVRDAVAGLMAQQERKKVQAETLTQEIEVLGKKVAGAVAFAKKVAAGQPKETVTSHPDYIRAMEAYKNFSSTLEEKKKRLTDIETDIQNGRKSIDHYKQQLINFQRDLEKLKSEKHEAIAEITMAKNQREVNEALAGIGKDGTAEQLSGLRDRVRKVSAQARITAELAGTSAAAEETEFLNLAEEAVAKSEFDRLIFGDAPTTTPEAPTAAPRQPEKLPE